jgi:hypothetical protein
MNQDWCNSCEDLISDSPNYSDNCFKDHPDQITHRLFVDMPMSWFSTDSSNYSLWLSQLPGEKKPSLYASYGDSDEESAVLIKKDDLKKFISDLKFAFDNL